MHFITAHFPHLIPSIMESAKWFFICMALFIPLAMIFPNDAKQPHFRRDMIGDTTYWFYGPLLYSPIYIFIVTALVYYVYPAQRVNQLVHEGLPPLRDLPVWLQVFLMLLATDILQYWMHRLFHHHPFWRFHAIHHSPVHVDWLSSARFHPVNIILYSTLMNAIVFLLGFSPEAFVKLTIFNAIYSPLVHANLNWTYGPFRYLLASPVFHRWHHTQPDKGGNKNFAPTFPFLDMLFGTFYMPKGELPSDFGTKHDPVPNHFLGQLAYPFKRQKP